MKSEKLQFVSKKECINFVKNEIIQGIKPYLVCSVMSFAVRDSNQTCSKYISLCYPGREYNYDPDRLPYCVRISDHDSFSLFSRKKPHYELRVIPFLRAEQKRDFDALENQHREISRRIHLVPLLEREALAEQLEQVTANIEYLVAQAHYSYSGNIAQVVSEMAEIALANPQTQMQA